METCNTCRFWLQHERSAEVGDCRRHPPQWYADERYDRDYEKTVVSADCSFPISEADEWCGEYQAKNNFIPADELCVTKYSDIRGT